MSLKGNEINIPGDKIEAATLLVSAIITKGRVTVSGTSPDDMQDFLSYLDLMKVPIALCNNAITAEWTEKIKGESVISGLPPSIDPDYEPL